jgi:ribosomal protein L32E
MNVNWGNWKKEQNKSNKVRRGLRGRDNGGYVTIAQYKSNWNCHCESPLYNKYILITKIRKIRLQDMEDMLIRVLEHLTTLF